MTEGRDLGSGRWSSTEEVAATNAPAARAALSGWPVKQQYSAQAMSRRGPASMARTAATHVPGWKGVFIRGMRTVWSRTPAAPVSACFWAG